MEKGTLYKSGVALETTFFRLLALCLVCADSCSQSPFDGCPQQKISAGRRIEAMKPITITKFIVRVTRNGHGITQYVRRTDKSPMQMTTNRKLALIMGKLTAQDALESLQRARCSPELVSVQVTA